jgi:hypothetical protein
VKRIFYLSVAIAAIVGTISVASAQNGRDWRDVRYDAYGQVISNGVLQTGPWSEPRRVTERPLRRVLPFTWEEKRHFDYQSSVDD